MGQVVHGEMERAFDAALEQVGRFLRTDLKTIDGDSARPQLVMLENELKRERAGALERGTIDREWLQKTVRWLVEWLPETEPSLIGALGRIVRSTAK